MPREEVEWGKRMIKLSIQFWTNNLPKGVDKKTAWGSGAIHMIANKHKGLKHNHVFFNNVEELLPKLQELLNRNEVKLIRMPAKYEIVDLKKINKKKDQDEEKD